MAVCVEAELCGLLRNAGLTVAVAESCTGGLVCHRITSVAGSSECFRGGVIAYANDLKAGLLGISADLIEEEGAVSEPVARLMAGGIRDKLGADFGIGITGIAGPGGGTPAKPVGTVFVGLAYKAETQVERLSLAGSRLEIKNKSSDVALKMIIDRLKRPGDRNG